MVRSTLSQQIFNSFEEFVETHPKLDDEAIISTLTDTINVCLKDICVSKGFYCFPQFFVEPDYSSTNDELSF